MEFTSGTSIFLLLTETSNIALGLNIDHKEHLFCLGSFQIMPEILEIRHLNSFRLRFTKTV